jgi:hypothetical protein
VRVGARALRAFARSPRAFIEDAERYLSQRLEPTQGLPAQAGLQGLPNVVPINFRVRNAGPPRLNVLVPGMALWAMSGGPNTALNLTLRVAREGVPLRYISTDVAADSDEMLWEHFRQLTGIHGPLDNVEIIGAHDRSVATEIGPDDIFFGTSWWTVQIIKRALQHVRSPRFIYLIQDFEPGLYPWSTAYALALETYSLDFRAIVNESLLLEHLCQAGVGRFVDAEFAAESVAFEPAVDRTKFHPDPKRASGRRFRLLFYARPNAPRNLFELGLHALKEAVEQGAFPADEWDLRFIGEPIGPVALTSASAVESEQWLDYEGYAGLLRSSDVGLALMLSPHTGYPALEMAASGMSVVTTAFSTKTPQRLRAISQNIIPAAPTVESITEALTEAYQRTPNLELRHMGSEVGLPPSWEDAFRPIVPRVLGMIEESRRPAAFDDVSVARRA